MKMDPPPNGSHLRAQTLATWPSVARLNIQYGQLHHLGIGVRNFQRPGRKAKISTPQDALKKQKKTFPKTNMTMEEQPFEDLFPIENGDFPMSC